MKTSLYLSVLPFDSSNLFTLDIKLPSHGSLINITVMGNHIYYAPYTLQITSYLPLSDHFLVDYHHNIYKVAMKNYESDFAMIYVHFLN